MTLEQTIGAQGAPIFALHGASADAQRHADRASVLLVENHPVYALGLKAVLADAPELEVVGHATTPAEAVALARQLQPAIILLDIGLGAESGLDLIPRFRRICPETRIAILTAHEDHDSLMNALRLGVHGYIHKETAGDAIIAAVRQVLRGERVAPQASAMTAALTELGKLLQQRECENSQLTTQELGILRLAAAGYKNKDIGAHEFLSEVTIKRKLQDIYRKLNVSGKPAAVAEAMRLGLI